MFKSDEPDFLDTRLRCGDGVDCRRDGITLWPTVGTHADEWERDASSAKFVGNL
jgi:hypothetical protein